MNNNKKNLKEKWLNIVYRVVHNKDLLNEYKNTYNYVKDELKRKSKNYEKDYLDFRLDCYESLLVIIENKK